MSSPLPPTDVAPEPGRAVVVVAGLVLCAGAALLAALIEVLLTPLYVGRWLFPVTLVLAIFTNVALPLTAQRLAGNIAAAAVPLVLWVVAVLVLSLPKPEGDVLLPAGSGGQQWVSYGLILVGAGAGAITLARSAVRLRSAPTDRTSGSSPARR
jgi:Family of unknown function (DUF6113)